MKFSLFILLLAGLQLSAQPTIQGLIAAENSFAAWSVAHSTKDAFIKYLDSTGIVFEKSEPVNGMKAWHQKEKGSSILNWHPQFAEIASSGDFGYTTGPWTLQPNTNTDSIVARGQYTTVWALNKKGEWKFLVDLGVSQHPSTDTQEVQIVTASKTKGVNIEGALIATEKSFIKAFKENKELAYKKYLSRTSLLNRNHILPALKNQQQIVIQNTPPGIVFSINGWGIANSGDLGYVYGTYTFGDKKENYLRIWRNETGGWKIAVEVLRY